MTDSTLSDLRFQLDLFNLARSLDLGPHTVNAEARGLEGLLVVCAQGHAEEPGAAT